MSYLADMHRRFAYMGQKTMENPLKIFYDQVMDSVIKQSQSPELSTIKDSRRKRFRSQGTQILESYQTKQKIQDVTPIITQTRHLTKRSQSERKQSETDYRDQLNKLSQQVSRAKIQTSLRGNTKCTNGFAALYSNNFQSLKRNPQTYSQLSLKEPLNIQNNSRLSKIKLYSERPLSRPLKSFRKNTPFTVSSNISQIAPFQKINKAVTNKSIQCQQQIPQVSQQFKQKSMRITKKSLNKSLNKQIVFIKPKFSKQQYLKKRLRKCFFAVYWLCCQTKQIKNKIKLRGSKHSLKFNSLSRSVYEHTSNFTETFQPVINKIKQYNHLAAIQQNSKVYLFHISEILKKIISILPKIKDILFKDRHTKTILHILTKQRQMLPDGYLTIYELDRIQMSKMFNYPVRTFETSVILLISFILIRLILLGVFANPIRLDPDLYSSPAWKKIFQDIKIYLYVVCIDIIEDEIQQGEYFDKIGNWKKIKEQNKYIPSQPLLNEMESSNDKQLISHNWQIKKVENFKNKLPNNWELVKDSIKQWVYQLHDELKLEKEIQTFSSKMTGNNSKMLNQTKIKKTQF